MKPKKAKKPARPVPVAAIDTRIGEALKRARRGIVPEMSQAAVGAAVGCSGQQIQKYEAGTDRIKLSIFIEVCRAMACDPAVVLDGIVQGAR